MHFRARTRLEIAMVSRGWNPRRVRALRRLAARSQPHDERLWVYEANALLWQGRFARAIEVVDRHGLDVVIKIEALFFDGRVEEAEQLFRAQTFRAHTADTIALEGFFAFHREEYSVARVLLERALRIVPKYDPLVSSITFFLASIANRLGDRDEASYRLAQTSFLGKTFFPGAWAREVSPHELPPPRSSLPSGAWRLFFLFPFLACAIAFGLAMTRSLPGGPPAHGRKAREVVPAKPDYATNEEQNELLFRQSEKLTAATTALEAERPGVVDLYFLGGAGWASQDVFLRETRSARDLFDERFDTKGRSLVVGNAADEGVPALANITLRRSIEAIGRRMNKQEDVLFLFLTSHGSSEGLALDFDRRSGFRDEVLRPNDLRSMLDDAGIEWRVLVIAGCESGVFIAPLASARTLVVTAAADDRNSYGCAMGNDYTEFGRAVFAEQLVRERSFPRAFRNAIAAVDDREADAGLLASRPQLSEGAEIGQKLAELEALARR